MTHTLSPTKSQFKNNVGKDTPLSPSPPAHPQSPYVTLYLKISGFCKSKTAIWPEKNTNVQSSFTHLPCKLQNPINSMLSMTHSEEWYRHKVMHGGKNWCSNYSCFVTRARNIECGKTISGKFNIAFSDKHPQVNHFLKESKNEKTGDHIQKGREGGEVANLYRLRIGRKTYTYRSKIALYQSWPLAHTASCSV